MQSNFVDVTNALATKSNHHLIGYNYTILILLPGPTSNTLVVLYVWLSFLLLFAIISYNKADCAWVCRTSTVQFPIFLLANVNSICCRPSVCRL